MTTRLLLFVLALVLMQVASAKAQNAPLAGLDTAYTPGSYRVFTGAGAPASIDDIVRALEAQQVVFVGETHDDPTAHMLELELLKRAALSYGTAAASDRSPRPVVLSLEFFERDVQLPLDEYLADVISESSFRAASRPWPRYQSDYRPLIEFSKEHKVPVIAANAPRRYVTMVTRNGRESLHDLSPEALAFLPPLPFGKASVAYRSQWISMMSKVMEQEGKKCGVAVPDADAPPGTHQNMGNQLDSQVLWDATMANSIARHLERQPDALVLHMVGGFHVERRTGTPEQLEAYAPGVRSMVVSLRPVENVDAFEAAPEGQWGDFVIQTEKARALEEIECRQFRAQREVK
jgi:uncharacterized iron-regulated protein